MYGNFAFGHPTREAFPPRVAHRRLGGSMMVLVSGELDIESADSLGKHLAVAVADAGMAPRLSIDLSGVTFMDSWGFAPIAGTDSELRIQGGSVGVVSPPRHVRRLLRMLGRDGMIMSFNPSARGGDPHSESL